MEDTIIAEEAAGWLVRLEEDPSEECRAQFTAWLEKSPRNMEEFLLVTAAYKELNGIDAARQMDVEELIGATDAQRSAEVIELGRSQRARSRPATPGARKNRVPLFLSAAAVGAIGISVWLVAPSILSPSYRTVVGEQRTVKLGDGSVVQMNTQSRVDVRFSDITRDVKLIEGEALFVVGKDAARPFRVMTDMAVIQALGTEFNIYRHDGAITVSVLDGRVRIENAQDKQELAAGEAARIGADGRIVRNPRPEVAKAVTWRQRKLDFRGTPLTEVAAEFNRYNELQIEVEGAAGEKQLNGVFNADEPRSLLRFLEQDPDLLVEHRSRQLVIRSR